MIPLTGNRNTQWPRSAGAFSRLGQQRCHGHPYTSHQIPASLPSSTFPWSPKLGPQLTPVYVQPRPTSHTNIVLRKEELKPPPPLSSPHGVGMSGVSCLTLKLTLSSSLLSESQPSVFSLEAFSSVQFSRSVVSDCDPMNCSTPGLPVHHQLPEFTQTHVHRVSDAIQPSHLLSSPSPPAFNLSQHQGLL